MNIKGIVLRIVDEIFMMVFIRLDLYGSLKVSILEQSKSS